MEKMKIKKEQLIEAAKNVPIIAAQEGWVLTFDREEGTLFYSPQKISDNAELHQITDECALYLDKNFKPKGMIIEYFKENFLEHHGLLIKELSQKVFDSKENLVIAKPEINNEDGKVAMIAKFLESTLIREAGTKLIPV